MGHTYTKTVGYDYKCRNERVTLTRDDGLTVTSMWLAPGLGETNAWEKMREKEAAEAVVTSRGCDTCLFLSCRDDVAPCVTCNKLPGHLIGIDSWQPNEPLSLLAERDAALVRVEELEECLRRGAEGAAIEAAGRVRSEFAILLQAGELEGPEEAAERLLARVEELTTARAERDRWQCEAHKLEVDGRDEAGKLRSDRTRLLQDLANMQHERDAALERVKQLADGTKFLIGELTSANKLLAEERERLARFRADSKTWNDEYLALQSDYFAIKTTLAELGKT